MKSNIEKEYFEKGIALMKSGLCEKAIKCFDKVIKINPQNPFVYGYQGSLYISIKEYEKALQIFDEGLKQNPDDYILWADKGVALLGLKRYDEAVRNMDKALEIKPNEFRVLSNKGAAFVFLKKFETAIEILNDTLKIEWNHDNAWYFKGLALKGLEKYDDALICFNKVLSINPDHKNALFEKLLIIENQAKLDNSIIKYSQENKLAFFAADMELSMKVLEFTEKAEELKKTYIGVFIEPLIYHPSSQTWQDVYYKGVFQESSLIEFLDKQILSEKIGGDLIMSKMMITMFKIGAIKLKFILEHPENELITPKIVIMREDHLFFSPEYSTFSLLCKQGKYKLIEIPFDLYCNIDKLEIPPNQLMIKKEIFQTIASLQKYNCVCFKITRFISKGKEILPNHQDIIKYFYNFLRIRV